LEDQASVENVMKKIGVHPEGITRMVHKAIHFVIYLENIGYKAAHILKQEILALGGDAAVSTGISGFTATETDVLLMGTKKQILRLISKLKLQPFGSKKVAIELEFILKNNETSARHFFCGNREFIIEREPLIMGVLNITPDSFSDGNLYMNPADAVDRALEMIEEGADIIDIGAESTRPGAYIINEQEELNRILPVLKDLIKRTSVPISVDTYKEEVARTALENGASLINDISGLRTCPGIASLAAKWKASLVIMHMQGTPQNMQDNPSYKDVNREILDFLRERVLFAESEGVEPDHIAIDPGIGFGKTVNHNLEILKNLNQYRSLGKPLLLGPSRKSFIGKILHREVHERLAGTAAVVASSVLTGADILRVHDIRFMKDVIQMTGSIKNYNNHHELTNLNL
ncbi:MAG: dihydropteroate synthase, partial [Candidatus Schekmanbacteria bacterium RBG_13_48_7]